MNTSGESATLSDKLDLLRAAYATGMKQTALIQRMRDLGLNQFDSIKLLRQLTHISLGQAKEAVHYSETWADCREANDALHEAAFAAAQELAGHDISVTVADPMNCRVLVISPTTKAVLTQIGTTGSCVHRRGHAKAFIARR